MHRYFIELAYNGSGYNGWQIQPNAPSVQEEINKALSLLLKQEINVTGAGRTDTGVHASFFVATLRVMSPFLTQKPWQTNSIVSWEKTSRSKIYTPCCLICMLDFRQYRVRTNIISIKARIRLLTRLPTDRTPYRTSG